MTKVITYGTFDLLHYGHLNLLRRARELGDYLVVGVTSDDFDKSRGKINVAQPLIERVEAVRATGLADEIIIEEYEGQKIDDIRRLGIDIFTVGSDWVGTFDYLNDYCRVVYLPRTEGVSSSEIRGKNDHIRLGLVGDTRFLNKVAAECAFVNGIALCGVCTDSAAVLSEEIRSLPLVTADLDELLSACDAVYIRSLPCEHAEQVRKALLAGKHVLCESPLALSAEECKSLMELAGEKGLALLEGLKTAYGTAYRRLLLQAQSGHIGKVVSVDAACTSLHPGSAYRDGSEGKLWDGIYEWGPTGLLPVLQLLGCDYEEIRMTAAFEDGHDTFVKMDLSYPRAVASVRVGQGVKTEGELVISGTRGYIYVPAPWWKTDYFEIRYENPAENRRFFYPLEGEGIRYELVAFVHAVRDGRSGGEIGADVSAAFGRIFSDFEHRVNVRELEN